jgi:hypothetical protein
MYLNVQEHLDTVYVDYEVRRKWSYRDTGWTVAPLTLRHLDPEDTACPQALFTLDCGTDLRALCAGYPLRPQQDAVSKEHSAGEQLPN